MQWRQLKHGSCDYLQACTLRQRILRSPLGLSLSSEELAGEAGQWHFGLFTDAGELTACLLIVPEPDGGKDQVKLRQMAVAESYQGQGLGRSLVIATENYLRGQDIATIVLHARTSAVPFYRRLGYRETGPVFTEVTIPHQKMWKNLLPNRGNST